MRAITGRTGIQHAWVPLPNATLRSLWMFGQDHKEEESELSLWDLEVPKAAWDSK